MQKDNNDSLIQAALNWIIQAGIEGSGVLPPAEQVAEDYRKKSNGDVEGAINSLIKWRTAYAAGTGFLTGCGGFVAMPVTIPAGLLASYAIAANTAGAIAHLRGYDLESDQVRTFILACLLGGSANEALKKTGIVVGNKVGQNFAKKIPGKILIELNKKIGFRLMTKAGEKGVVNIMKVVPLIGGPIGGAFDATMVKSCGKAAKSAFVAI